jgi:hypothetical protein
VLEQGKQRAAESAAENIGCEDNLYQLFGSDNPFDVDAVWTRYEGRLGPALDELARPGQKTINAKDWLRALVPFIASLFVRGKEFGARYDSRMAEIYADEAYSDPDKRSDNTNNARLIEFNRFLAPIMAAQWVVMHTDGTVPVVTNELGFTYFLPQGHTVPSIAIPIASNAILGITRTWPNSGRLIMKDGGTGQWRTTIERIDLTLEDQHMIHDALAKISHSFLIGPTASTVEPHQKSLNDDSPLNPDIMGAFWPNPLIRLAHEFEWHRAVTAISKKSTTLTQQDLENFDLDVIARDWMPALIVPVNLRPFPTGLRLRDDKIYLGMTEVPGFTDGSDDSRYVIRSPKA